MRARIRTPHNSAFLLVLLVIAVLAAAAAYADPAAPATEPDVVESSDTTADDARSGNGGCCCQGCQQGGGQGQGRGKGRCRNDDGEEATEGPRGACKQGKGKGGKGAGKGPNRPEVVKAHSLLDAREDIQRRVEQIPGGVRTTTLADNPETLDLLRSHVRDMETLLHEGGRIRMWDPLFAEFLEHREQIQMSILEIEDGVEVTVTSEDPWVTELIRAHATKLVEFVYRGWEAYNEPTPLPERPASAPPVAEAGSP